MSREAPAWSPGPAPASPSSRAATASSSLFLKGPHHTRAQVSVGLLAVLRGPTREPELVPKAPSPCDAREVLSSVFPPTPSGLLLLGQRGAVEADIGSRAPLA